MNSRLDRQQLFVYIYLVFGITRDDKQSTARIRGIPPNCCAWIHSTLTGVEELGCSSTFLNLAAVLLSSGPTNAGMLSKKVSLYT